MDIQFVKASMDAPVFEDGTKLFQAGHVQSFESETDDQLTTITAMVKDNRSDKVFEARIITGDKWIVDTECECRSFHITGKPCRHIAAALIYALEHQEVKEEEKKSDPAIEDFITSYANAASRPKNLPSSPLVVDAHLSMGENHDIKAEFRLGLPGRRKFIIQQISDFANAMNHESERKYGNTLSFTHCLDAFAPEYRGLVRMLRALDSSTDSYLADDDPFYTRSALSNGRQYIHRRMSIRGRYSDMFFECLKHLPFYYFDGKEENEYTISEDKPELSFSLEKEEPGYSFSCRIPPFFIGERNLYFLNTQKHTIEILPNTSADIPALFAGLSAVNEKSFYIAPNELSLFSRNIFPLMKELMNSDTDFNPEDYAPAKPKFEIYLDMPEEDTVTGEMYAIYPNDKYNALGKTHDSLTRDIIAESDMKEFFVNWFNNFDRDKKIAILKEDEDALYSLIKNGIPAMQEKASVFISDAMKKMNVIKVSHISVGVSVTQNLLRLDLVQDTLTRKQLAELLSRYDRKKKFYRLKDGTFIDMDDSLRK
ncbi:MAG: SNF2 helicase associated domain-containing protein, partial [Solobacterium sp.]|nr:SNF2 helicase associated domain-containing protein [Solobacterium sp.]